MRTLYRNGRFHTPADSAADALLVDGDKIVWIGALDPADGPTADRVHDLRQAPVTPAFVDAHVHATATGLALAARPQGRSDHAHAAKTSSRIRPVRIAKYAGDVPQKVAPGNRIG